MIPDRSHPLVRSEPALRFNGFTYDDPKSGARIFDRFDLVIDRGVITCLFGRNVPELAPLLLSDWSPPPGTVYVLGRDMSGMPGRERKRLFCAGSDDGGAIDLIQSDDLTEAAAVRSIEHSRGRSRTTVVLSSVPRSFFSGDHRLVRIDYGAVREKGLLSDLEKGGSFYAMDAGSFALTPTVPSPAG